jgi:hypothetical protein
MCFKSGEKMKIKDVLLLSWKKAWIIVVSGFIFIVLHNLLSAIFRVEEAFFFILVIFVLPMYVILAIVYSLIYYIKRINQK